MFSELKKIQLQVDEVIKKDSFPFTIEPEYLREAVCSYPFRGGKRLRPALTMWACGLLGGDPEDAEYAAASVEIYHNWTLIHDDIIDRDNFRRGAPTAHKSLARTGTDKFGLGENMSAEFGRSFAVLAGDLVHAWSVSMLLKSARKGISDETLCLLCGEMQDFLGRNLISGEALDVEFSHRDIEEITLPEVERMMNMKTGALLSFSAAAGALIALRGNDLNDKRIMDIRQAMAYAGTAFQLRDDWLGIFGNEKDFGKPLGSDLTERKPTFLIVSALNKLSPAGGDKLLSFSGREKYSAENLSEIRSILSECGAAKHTLERSREITDKALILLDAFPESPYRTYMKELLNYLVTRKI